jgi:DNA-binding Xre family transcriptional regulator
MKIQFRLNEILKEKGIGLREAARICGISYPTVQNISANVSAQISLRTIEKLCEGLKISYVELFYEKSKK